MRLALGDSGHRRYMTAVLLIGIVGLVTREAIVVPFTVGYAAARRLVEQEDQEAQLHKQASEYRAATEFYRTPEGQEAAGRLALNVPAPGERRAILKPEAPDGLPRPGVRNTISDIETRLTQSLHFQMRVFHRWAHDPPRETSPASAGKGTQPPKAPASAK
jgi:hypothetical protein